MSVSGGGGGDRLNPRGEPILIPCEGSENVGHRQPMFFDQRWARCAMCGEILPADPDWTVWAHTRDDVLARIERGDFA